MGPNRLAGIRHTHLDRSPHPRRDCGAHVTLLGLVPGRPGTAYTDWLKACGTGLTSGIKAAGPVVAWDPIAVTVVVK